MRHCVAVVLVAALAAGCSYGGFAGSAPSSSAAESVKADPSAPASETAVSCSQPTSPSGDSEASIADVLARDPRFGLFCAIVEETYSPAIGLSWLAIWDWPASRMGDNQDGVTVFAPTNEAFAALDPAILTALESGSLDNELRYSLLGHHYVHRLYPSTDFEEGPQQTWVGAGAVELSLEPLTYAGCNIVETDIRASNGYIHAIDCVALPDAVAEGSHGSIRSVADRGIGESGRLSSAVFGLAGWGFE